MTLLGAFIIPTKPEAHRKICDIEVDGINYRDAPDFADAFIASAAWEDTGEPFTDAELEDLNEDSDFVREQVEKRIY